MKHLLWFTCSLFALVVGTLFLPYETHELRNGWGGAFIAREIRLGLTTWGVYPIVVTLGLITLLTGIFRKELAPAITGIVLTVLAIPYLFFFAVILVLHISFTKGHYQLGIGFQLLCTFVAAYLIVLVVHLIVVVRQRKQGIEEKRPVSLDLLDDL